MRKAGVIIGVLAVVLAVLGYVVYDRLSGAAAGGPGGGRGTGGRGEPAAAPVQVAAVERGDIELRRVFSGSLESPAEFIVSSKVAGRIEKLTVNVADMVQRGQVVAELDDDEYVQAEAQAAAELAVAKANLVEASSSVEIAERELTRIRTLRERGVASESQLDVAEAGHLAKRSAVAVAEAQVTRAQAALAAAQIRLSYTRVVATWTAGDDRRIVGERFAIEGDTVAANAPLLSIVELDPVNAIVYVTEKDYGHLRVGQQATLTTDAYPGRSFQGVIARIAPVFRQASRQARVEIEAANPDHELKPGLFVRAEVVLGRAQDATIIPGTALTRRRDTDGVFVVNQAGNTVTWRPVEIGIRQGDRVQVTGQGITGRVVTLGQQLVDDGAKITIPPAAGTSSPGTPPPATMPAPTQSRPE
ncbi:MAG: efflux RND transporter periplasmic adaptor subunit [Phycisphaeraceae bacterium]